MDTFGYAGAEMARFGAGLEGPRAMAEYTPHYELRALVNRLALNQRLGQPGGITGLDVALRQQQIAVGLDSEISTPGRRIDFGAQPEEEGLTLLRTTARTRPRKQAVPRRLDLEDNE